MGKRKENKMLKINETPVRTSKNFNINDIELDVNIPQKKEFSNVKIISNDAILENEVSINKLSYGNGKLLEENVEKNSNHKIKIVENKKCETIEIIYTFDDNNTNLVNSIEIYAKSEINVVIKYLSDTDKECFHNGIIKIYGEKNSKANITTINLLNDNSNNFEAIENKLENSANLKYLIIDLGAQNSTINYYANIIGIEAKNEINTIYIGKNGQIKDFNYIAHLKGEKTNVNIDVQGALKDEAKKHFKGTIDFKKGCKKAKGNENEYCYLLSDKAKSIALPMLLCTEDDVEGNHSSASGKIDEQKLFYLMSRGLNYKEATKLIVKANFNKIVQQIKDEELRNDILNEIDKRLD